MCWEACNVVSLVRSAATSFSIYAERQGVQLTCSCSDEDDGPLIMLDKIRLRQAGVCRVFLCAMGMVAYQPGNVCVGRGRAREEEGGRGGGREGGPTAIVSWRSEEAGGFRLLFL